MSFLPNMKIGARLAVGFGLVIVAGLVVAGYGRLALSEVGEEVRLLNEDRIVKVIQARDLRENVLSIAESVRNIALLTDPAAMAAEAKSIEEIRAANGKLTDQLDQTITTDKGRALLQAALQARVEYNRLVDKAIEAGLANRNDEAGRLLMGEGQKAQEAYLTALGALVDFQKELMAASKAATKAEIDTASAVMIGIALLATLGGAFVAWLVAGSVTRPLQRAVAVTERIAQGDLSTRIELGGRDETGQLLASLARMQDSLAGVVATVRGNAESVATASAQIAQGNQDLSQRTEEQASALQQTAASMEQLGSTVTQNADNARQADQLAQGASRVAGEGGEVVAQVVQTMKGINESSRRIADIIGVIDGIAFQTNILALNAAVEAARAGEQGRGFAVVAGEVRSLAQRSAEAAKEIKSLITASVEQVEQGTTLADKAGATMDEVVQSIKRVTDIMAEISAASAEQSSGVRQVGDAVSQMDQTTQQNAALVEESAAAAESLKQQAQQLVQAVAVFKVAGATGVRPAPVVAAAPAPVAPRTRPQPVTRPAPAAVAAPKKAAPAAQPAKPAKPTATAATAEADEWATF